MIPSDPIGKSATASSWRRAMRLRLCTPCSPRRATSPARSCSRCASWARDCRAIPTRTSCRASRCPRARSARACPSRRAPRPVSSWTASRRACSPCSATANARKGRYGRLPCSRRIATSTTWWPSWTATACRSTATRPMCAIRAISQRSSRPSAGMRAKWTATTWPRSWRRSLRRRPIARASPMR